VPGIGIIAFDSTGAGFALNEPVFRDDLTTGFPMIGAIQIGVKPLLDSLVQPSKGQCITASQFPVQQLPGFIIDRFPNPELLTFFSQNATVHPVPPLKPSELSLQLQAILGHVA
jgi:hypothetical protein